MKLKSSGMVAITLQLKPPGGSLDSTLQRRHPPSQLYLSTFQIPFTTDDTPLAHQLVHYPHLNDISYNLMGHLSLMDKHMLFQTFVILNTSNFRLQSYSQSGAGGPNDFLEHAPPPNVPSMRVILRQPQNPHVTRLQPIRLSLGDVFYLRILLQTRPARSHDELQTVNGVVHSSFQEACIALNLFSNETEAEYCFTEAVESLRTPYQTQLLFIHMLTNSCIATPASIWAKFQESLSEDFQVDNGGNWTLAFSSALLDIAEGLQEYGKSPDDYGLPQPEYAGDEVIAEVQRWSTQIPQLLSMATQALTMFNSEQLTIFNVVWDAIQRDQPMCLFIDGKAGRGKTFLVNALCSQVRGHQKIVLAMATSAFAAQLYPGGRTAHSTFKVNTFDFFLDLISKC